MTEEQDRELKLDRAERITVLTHYYRAEVKRSLAWRERLDRTTNWAVGGSAALLGFAFSHPEIPHIFFLFALAIVYVLLYVESRRYRFYDAYEYRVRLLNQNFIYGVLTRGILPGEVHPDTGAFWRAELASDLKYPQYKMDLSYALGRRLKANYIYLFVILIAGWLLKIKLHPLAAHSWPQYLEQARIGIFPGWITLALMALFVGHMLVLLHIGRRIRGGRDIIRSQRRGTDFPPDELGG